MRKIFLCFLGLLFVSLTSASIAETKPNPKTEPILQHKNDVIQDDNIGFLVERPKGWVLDDESGRNEGCTVVFYPKHTTWANSTRVIYITNNPKSRYPSVENAIKEDTSKFKNRHPGIRVTPSQMLVTADHRKVRTLDFQHEQDKYFELVAYIEEPHTITMITLSTQSKAEFNQNLPLFKKFVSSYYFLTDEFQNTPQSSPKEY